MKIGLASLDNMRRLMTLVEAGRLDATPLITHRMPLADFEKAYTIFEKKEENVVKVVLKP
jgi:threonine dehydrogenase-like Zn-dependent dehydrogenase